MNGPTIRRRIDGSARRTSNPSPRSRVRGRMAVSIGDAGSRSKNGSSGVRQVISPPEGTMPRSGTGFGRKQALGYNRGVPPRRTALWTLLAFGCATVRIPVTAPEQPADAPGTIAPPITELWLESSEEVPPAVAAAADAQARAALSAALAGLDVPANAAGATDAVLFVRERAVGLTDERRSQQNWAKVGIVVGIVVVAAVVVYLAVRGGKGSPAPAKSAPAPSAPAPVAVRPHVVPATPRPPVPPSLGHAVPFRGPYRPAPIQVGFFFQFWIPPRPLVLAPETPPDEDRGFFSGPHTALQLDLVDRASGRLLWSRAVAGGEDPLDEGGMSKLLDEALAGQGWARRSRR